jgi:hypothetical protein
MPKDKKYRRPRDKKKFTLLISKKNANKATSKGVAQVIHL